MTDDHSHSDALESEDSRTASTTASGRAFGNARWPERVVAIVAAALSVVVFGAIMAAREAPPVATDRAPTTAAPSAEAGDPALAAQLAARGRDESGSDPVSGLRWLLAAHVVAPDRAEHRIALAEQMLKSIGPVRRTEGRLDVTEPILFGALTSDASVLVTGGGTAGQIWQTEVVAGPTRVRLARSLDVPVRAAAGGGTLTRTNLLVAGPQGVSAWRVASPAVARPLDDITTQADALAVTVDGLTAVTVAATTATIWDIGGLGARAQATMFYDQPVTAVAFAPGSNIVLAAGHSDGGVTVHAIDLATTRTTARALTGVNSVQTVSLSADGSTVVALGRDGSLAVWDLRSEETHSTGTAHDAFAAGSGRVWVSPRGDYAFVADASGSAALWSLVDSGRPRPMLPLQVGGGAGVPAMISMDGRTVVTLDATGKVVVWDIGSLVDTLSEPTRRACQLTGMTEQLWDQIVVDDKYGNPCVESALPTLKADHD